MLCAAVMAWKSPVKWRLIFSMGSTWACPPPAAPPFMPKQGPSEGSRRATTVLRPMRLSPRASPIETVVLPIPARVAEIEVTRMRRLLCACVSSMRRRGTFAMYLPCCSKSFSSMPIWAATSRMGSSGVACAISRSVMGGMGERGGRIRQKCAVVTKKLGRTAVQKYEKSATHVCVLCSNSRR